jgi:hypothetical protein
MNTKKRDRQSKTHRSGLALVAALALILALSPAAARPLEDAAPGQDAERIVARAFAQLDNMIDARGCVKSSTVEKMDQLFIELHDWDARSRLHSTEYPVCSSTSVSN